MSWIMLPSSLKGLFQCVYFDSLFTFFPVVWTHSSRAHYTTSRKSHLSAISFLQCMKLHLSQTWKLPKTIHHHAKAGVWVWFCQKIYFAFNSLCPNWIGMRNMLCSAYLLIRPEMQRKKLKPPHGNINFYLQTLSQLFPSFAGVSKYNSFEN